MIATDLSFFLIAAPAVIFASVSKAGFGSGAAFVSSSILALVLDPGHALGIMLPLLMLVDAFSMRPYWKKWSWPDARLLILGGIPGTALGAWLYTIADANLFRLLIGAVCLLFVLWQSLLWLGVARMLNRPMPPSAGLIAGVVAGFTSFVSHAGGPPASVYLLSRRLTKTEFQGTTVVLFWVLNIVKFVPYAFLGIFTAQTLLIDLMLAPFALLGAWIGIRAHALVPERAFFALTYVLLTATGLRLIWIALA
ncbi:hypothetical protein SAMN05421688_3428 [Poseidonocella pacifica]|uniref:Probable membrane transporter protein n=1 Tax=Poseidonocella pacifica TaxID=871651 RepID=A0A1I0YXE9_9RHOB|nr:sulfite exporter TauE/SafE family protein [Poseidonocella pacifica]SFB17727.1 hypothetical protein SAMN05421688_3428 [Poseidonocella pacifica]